MGLVRKLFTEIDVEVEAGDFTPTFTWARVSSGDMKALVRRIMLAARRTALIADGLAEDDASLSDEDREAMNVEGLLVAELAEKYLNGWSGVPGEDGDLDYSGEAVKDLLSDRDWIKVIEQSFFAAQEMVPEILIKNVLTSGAGGRPAGATTEN